MTADDRNDIYIDIRDVDGRYPDRPTVFRGENITPVIRPLGEWAYRIRLDDKANIDVWIDFTIDVRRLIEVVLRGKEGTRCSP